MYDCSVKRDVYDSGMSERDRRTVARLGLYLYIALYSYMAVWGFGQMRAEQCSGALDFFGLLLPSLAIIAAIAFLCWLAYLICKGNVHQAASESSTAYSGFRHFIAQAYSYGPTLTSLAVLVTLAGLYSMFFRYHNYNREAGFYVYDRLLHHGQYVERVDCPRDNG